MRGALDVLPVPLVQVDVARLHRETAARQERRLRRWRRLALVACAAAAIIGLLAASSHWEFPDRGPSNGAALGPASPCTGTAHSYSAAARTAACAAGSGGSPPANPDVEGACALLSALVQALAEEAKQREGQRKEEITALQEQIHDLSQYLAQARQATDKDLAAVYAVLFPEKTKGQTP